ncbi:hypothetical protein B0H10DRAFT_1960382 [Mycena sp. CBHHK59/15]|nr:hypothetical protein B0H10DRAFT_1960382 [Mycena sp. CBHHK59/15]
MTDGLAQANLTGALQLQPVTTLLQWLQPLHLERVMLPGRGQPCWTASCCCWYCSCHPPGGPVGTSNGPGTSGAAPGPVFQPDIVAKLDGIIADFKSNKLSRSEQSLSLSPLSPLQSQGLSQPISTCSSLMLPLLGERLTEVLMGDRDLLLMGPTTLAVAPGALQETQAQRNVIAGS